MSAAEKNTTYNGWTNYETWNVKLWIDNEQGSHEYWREVAREIWQAERTPAYPGQTPEQSFVYQLAETIKDQFEEEAQNILETARAQCSVWADLLGAAMSEVNWYEIAESYLEDVKE